MPATEKSNCAKDNVITARADVLESIERAVAASPSDEARACFKLAKSIAGAAFDSLAAIAEKRSDDSESDDLAEFIEIIFPRALAVAAMGIADSVTPTQFLHEAVAILTLEFSNHLGGGLREAIRTQTAPATKQ